VLHQAAEQGHWKVAQLLVEKGADVSLQTTEGETVLHKAFQANDKVSVTELQLLFDKGVNTKSQAKYRTTALYIAEGKQRH
jgi:ankyrin repeat protein